MKKKLKRFILKYLIPIDIMLISLDIVGAGIIYNAYKKQKIEQINNFGKEIGSKTEQINNFGTVENSKYLISDKEAIQEDIPTPEIIIKKDNIEENCSKEFLEEIKFNENDIGLITDRESIRNNCNRALNDLVNYKIEKIDEINLSKTIFESLTGKKFPNFITISKENDMKEMDGYHNYKNKKIAYKDIHPLINLNTLLHEYGHMIVQHNEENTTKNTSTLEEACAYAFENAGLIYLMGEPTDTNLKNFAINAYDIFLSSDCQQVREFYQGRDDKEKHNEGAALFRAAFNVIKGPYETFNYLATLKGSDLDNLDPKIKEMMEYN